ncbi:metallophosphoesterase [archaeon]|nr:metallophosphoesterase [archaeon]
MKILAFTDTHFKEGIPKKLIDKAKDVDVVVCAGDFTRFGRNIDKIMKDFLKFEKPVAFVHGNHEEGEDFKNYKQIKYLHKKGFIAGDYLFVGYGGGGFSTRYPDLEEMIPRINKRKGNKKVIFVTHAPVYGTSTDYLEHAGHVGSKSALKFIKEVKPILVICGHIEENFGQIDHVGKTIIILPNDTGRIIEV